MTYDDTLKEIASRTIMPKRAPALDRTRDGLNKLKLPLSPENVVLIAGTNGKGSVAASLEILLRSAGKKTGFYSSPHLISINERIRLNGKPISDEQFVDAYQRVQSRAEGLSHFELLTLMAAEVFFRQTPVEIAILEVGLGGSWDATNAIPHETAVVTSIGHDHMEFLGNSLPEIARNKFGIVTPEVKRLILGEIPKDCFFELSRATEQFTGSTHQSPIPNYRMHDGETFLQTPWGETPIRLPGRWGAQNSSTALEIFQSLGFPGEKHFASLADLDWPGRMELITSTPCRTYLSGDHNAEGIAALLENLPHYKRQRLHLLVGVGKRKELEAILEPLTQLPDSILHLTETPFQGRSIRDYGKWKSRAATTHSHPIQSLQSIQSHAQPGDMILVTGSLYLVGAIRESLLRDKKPIKKVY